MRSGTDSLVLWYKFRMSGVTSNEDPVEFYTLCNFSVASDKAAGQLRGARTALGYRRRSRRLQRTFFMVERG